MYIPTIQFGKFKGTPWGELTSEYLWDLARSGCDHSGMANKILNQRNVVPRALSKHVIITDHALRRATYRLQGHYLETRGEGEDYERWLLRQAREALTYGKTIRVDLKDNTGKLSYNKMMMVFKYKSDHTILLTVAGR
jgi:hypothetical protein